MPVIGFSLHHTHSSTCLQVPDGAGGGSKQGRSSSRSDEGAPSCSVLGLRVGSVSTAMDLRSLPAAIAGIFSAHRPTVRSVATRGGAQYRAGGGSSCETTGLALVRTGEEFPFLSPGQSDLLCSAQSHSLSLVQQGVRVVRHLLVKQFQLYWQCGGQPGPKQAAPSASASTSNGSSDDFLVRPLDCALRLSLGAPTAATAAPPPPLSSLSAGHREQSPAAAAAACPLEVLLCTQMLQLQLNPAQLLGILQLVDDSETWARRNRYGRFRPPGWRTQPESSPHRRGSPGGASFAGGVPASRSTAGSLNVVLGRTCSAGAVQMHQDRPFAESPRSAPLPLLPTSWSVPGGLESSSAASTSQAPAFELLPDTVPGGSAPNSLEPMAPPHGWRSYAAVTASPSPFAASTPPELSSSGLYLQAGGESSRLLSSGGMSGSVLLEAVPEWPPPAPSQGRVTWQDVWRYAGRAVLYDIRMRRRSTNAPRWV